MRRPMEVLGIAALFLVLASCRHDTTLSSDDPSPNTTLSNTTTVAASKSVDADAVSKPPPTSDDAASDDAASDEEDPLAGMSSEMLAQLAEAEAAAAAEELAGVCGTCHIDAVDVFIGSLHQTENVGCTDCHGSSEPHVEDENNDVKPDTVFTPENTDRLCGQCHEDDCTRPVEPKADQKSRPKTCINCHGPHNLMLSK